VKLVHLVGFIKKICHDAQSNERQIQYLIFAKFSKDLLATIVVIFDIHSVDEMNTV